MIEESWGYNHFVIYLYLCVANADYNLADEEIETFHSKFDQLHIEDKDYGTVIKEVLQEYKNHSDKEMNEFIMDYSKKLCKENAQKVQILNDLKDIIQADGIVKDVESMVYRNIKRMLNV